MHGMHPQKMRHAVIPKLARPAQQRQVIRARHAAHHAGGATRHHDANARTQYESQGQPQHQAQSKRRPHQGPRAAPQAPGQHGRSRGQCEGTNAHELKHHEVEGVGFIEVRGLAPRGLKHDVAQFKEGRQHGTPHHEAPFASGCKGFARQGQK